MDAEHRSDREITDLLREIRDLQKAHYDRYVQFTGTIMDADRASRESAQAAQLEARRHMEEMRQAVRRSQTMALVSTIVLFVFLVLVAGFYVAGALFLPFISR